MERLRTLFGIWADEPCVECLALGGGGSSRRYYRLRGATRCCIGTIGDNVRENEAFFSFTNHLRAKGMSVPEVYLIDQDRCHYLQQDLGDQSLYGLLYSKKQQGGGFDSEMLRLYKQALADLDRLQKAGRDLDFSVGFPRAAFDRRAMLWDLNYFKYYYLKMVNIPFNEQLLEDDYQSFMDYLLSADDDFFLYRDFQSRNIMLSNGEVYFIDYQGGRKGALQYDIASLLYDAKADLSPEVREELLETYMDHLSEFIPVDRVQFKAYFNAFSLIRIMQAMGAYGYRGYFERKVHFLQSVPYAIRNMRYLLQQNALPNNLPELRNVLQTVVDSYVEPISQSSDKLTVTVQSFSFKKGIPEDKSGNGGGFVFDCRALPNPGREKQYATFTGKDECVKQYLRQYKKVETFENHVFAIVDMSVDNYLERRFNNLMVNFGCTGGQHRSVYFAEQTAAHLRAKYPQVVVELRHTVIS